MKLFFATIRCELLLRAIWWNIFFFTMLVSTRNSVIFIVLIYSYLKPKLNPKLSLYLFHWNCTHLENRNWLNLYCIPNIEYSILQVILDHSICLNDLSTLNMLSIKCINLDIYTLSGTKNYCIQKYLNYRILAVILKYRKI